VATLPSSDVASDANDLAAEVASEAMDAAASPSELNCDVGEVSDNRDSPSEVTTPATELRIDGTM